METFQYLFKLSWIKLSEVFFFWLALTRVMWWDSSKKRENQKNKAVGRRRARSRESHYFQKFWRRKGFLGYYEINLAVIFAKLWQAILLLIVIYWWCFCLKVIQCLSLFPSEQLQSSSSSTTGFLCLPPFASNHLPAFISQKRKLNMPININSVVSS